VLVTAGVITAQERQTFRTATRLVEVSVVVTHKDGRPITGLTAADFTLEEDGKVQPISFFDARDGNAPPRSGESSFAIPDTPNSFTNVARTQTGTSTVLLLDRTNAAFDSQWFARKHIDRYLEGMRPDDRVALYVLDGMILVLHEFTSTAQSLRQALDTYHARVTGDYAASKELPLPSVGAAPWLDDPSGRIPEYFMRKRAVDTFEMLEFLADHLAGITGRKNLIWVSEAFPILVGLDALEVKEKMYRANKALSHAQVSVYPVDSRGLVGAYSVYGRQVVFNNLTRVRGNIETMEIVAEETGGRVYANTNALDRSIVRAIDDSRLSYVLGYYPPSTTDGRFRRIDVKVRRPGVHVRHRSGYYAAPPTSRAQDAGNSAVRQALESPLQTTGISLTATATRRSDQISFLIRLDPSTLSLERIDGRWRATLDVLVAQVDARGRGAVDAAIPVSVSLTDDQRSRALVEGITVTRSIAPKDGTTELRLVARDVATGSVGSLVIPTARVK
jgi:VWFA-related protein